MSAELPPHKPRKRFELLQLAIILGVILSPLAVKMHLDHQARLQANDEYHSTRPHVLAEIGHAVERRDLSTLQKIHAKFASAVSDREFLSLLAAGLAEVTAREAEVELTAAKHLDMARHREESSVGLEPAGTPYQGGSEQNGERLSVLPQ